MPDGKICPSHWLRRFIIMSAKRMQAAPKGSGRLMGATVGWWRSIYKKSDPKNRKNGKKLPQVNKNH